MSIRPGARVRVRARTVDDGGAGVGPAAECEIHVADLLPGEEAEVEIEHASPHRPRAWGRVVARPGPLSPDRAAPACPAFGRCGGCLWQHLRYPAQLELKTERVADALSARGVVAPVARAVGSPAVLGYRSRGKYVVGTDAGRLILGAYEPRSHRIVDTAGCRVVEPVIDRVAGRARDALAASGLPVYDERRRRGLLRYVVIRAGAGGQALVTLVTTSAAPRAAMVEIAAELLAGEAVAGVAWLRNDATGGVIAAGDLEHLGGAPTLPEDLGGVAVEVGYLAFLQVNRAQAAALYRAAAEASGAGPGTRAVDLYCGAGGFAFALAGRGAEVLGIETHPEAVAAARAAAVAAGLSDRVRFETADAAALPRLAGGPVDVLVVDPPRKGLTAEVRAAIADLAPSTLVYVSCHPDSLARDLADLSGAGYCLESAQPYDLMPGTSQIETLAVCRRAG